MEEKASIKGWESNFAASLNIPVVFVCQNNGWAISVPTKIQCSGSNNNQG